MMNYPPLEGLMDKVDSRYTLVVAAAMRARGIMDEAHKEGIQLTIKPVSLALREIEEGKVSYRRLNSLPKTEEPEEM